MSDEHKPVHHVPGFGHPLLGVYFRLAGEDLLGVIYPFGQGGDSLDLDVLKDDGWARFQDVPRRESEDWQDEDGDDVTWRLVR